MKPKVKDLGDIGNVIAAVGVIVSLLIVAWEIRGNTVALRAEARLQMIELGNQAFDWAKDPAFAQLMVRVSEEPDSMSAAESQQYFAYAIGVLNMWEQGLLLHEDGLMNDNVWIAWNEGMSAAMDDPGIRRVWGISESYYTPEFRKHVNQVVSEQ